MVNRNILFIISGFIWLAVGLMLLSFARIRIDEYEGEYSWLFVAAGLLLAFIKFRYIFRAMVDQNLARLYSLREKEHFYKFLPPSGFVLVVVMTLLGISMRKFGLPGQYIALIDIAIGFGLFFSGIRHFQRYIRSDCAR
jgi:uncharacterized membrane protein YkgB